MAQRNKKTKNQHEMAPLYEAKVIFPPMSWVKEEWFYFGEGLQTEMKPKKNETSEEYEERCKEKFQACNKTPLGELAEDIFERQYSYLKEHTWYDDGQRKESKNKPANQMEDVFWPIMKHHLSRMNSLLLQYTGVSFPGSIPIEIPG